MGFVEFVMAKVAELWPSVVMQALCQKEDVTIADVVAKYGLEALHFEQLTFGARDERVYTRFFQDPDIVQSIDKLLRVETFDDDSLHACYTTAASKIDTMDLMGYLFVCGCITAVIITRGTDQGLLGALTPEQIITKSQIMVIARITDEIDKRVTFIKEFLFGAAKVIGFATVATTAFYATRWLRS